MKNIGFLFTIILTFYSGSIFGQIITEIPGLSEVPDSPAVPLEAVAPLVPDLVTPLSESPVTPIGPVKVTAPEKENLISLPKKDQYDTVPFSFEALPTYIKKNGKLTFRPRVTYVSLNYLAGRTHKLHGAGLGIIGQWAQEEVIGAQFSNIFNFSGGRVYGGQFTTISNIAGGKVKGAQFSTVSNLSRGNLVGAQFTTVSNVALGKVIGAQFATVSNVAFKKVHGAQLATVSNVALGNLEGAQLAVISNVVRKRIDGAQVSVLFNYAKESHGVQVGFVNIAQESKGVPVGFLNLAKNGEIHPELWTDELGMANLSLKTGNKNFYGLINVAGKTGGTLNKKGVFGFGLGWGAKVPFQKAFLSSDLSSHVYLAGPDWWEEWPAHTVRLRAGGGFQLFSHLGLTAGLSMSGQIHKNEGSANLDQDYSKI